MLLPLEGPHLTEELGGATLAKLDFMLVACVLYVSYYLTFLQAVFVLHAMVLEIFVDGEGGHVDCLADEAL